jgi:ribose-phosphate pyrophosphokinase
MNRGDIGLFALGASRGYGERIGRYLGVPMSPAEERDFEDGEHKTRALNNVRGKDAFVVHSLYGDREQSVNDKLCRLLFFIGALRDASAERITAVVPYLAYARKDRKTKSRDPVTTRYVAQLFEAVGTDRVVTLDVHNLAAFQNAFRCQTDHLEVRKAFVDYFAPRLKDTDAVVVSPDVGGVKRAELFRESLSARLGRPLTAAFMEKRRSMGIVSGETIVGEVAGRVALIIDDLISTGTTVRRAASACRHLGATRVFAAATHGLFMSGAEEVVADPVLDGIVITDTVPPFRLAPALAEKKVVTLDMAPLFAEAIRRIHTGGSIVDLIEP